METLSRVKKYEELRKQIENDTVALGETSQDDLQGHVHSVNEIDPSIFKKITVNEEPEPYTPERERKETSSDAFAHTNDDFRNEYLDDFINEVREYNIKKGNRESEDTQTDILNQLNAVTRIQSSYIPGIEGHHVNLNEKEVLSQASIAAKVKDLIEKEELEPIAKEVICTPFAAEPQEEKKEDLENHTKEEPILTVPKPAVPSETADVILQPAAEQSSEAADTLCVHMPKSSVIESDEVIKEDKTSVKQRRKKLSKTEQKEQEREKKLQQKLVEETQQLRDQLNEYEDDLSDLNEGVVKTNKLLNVILGCLILALLVIIGIIFYWVIQAGGIV